LVELFSFESKCNIEILIKTKYIFFFLTKTFQNCVGFCASENSAFKIVLSSFQEDIANELLPVVAVVVDVVVVSHT
jgi:hypothetical protein